MELPVGLIADAAREGNIYLFEDDCPVGVKGHMHVCLKVECMGILQEWYDFKNAAEQAVAEEWLEEHELEIKDGKIVKSIYRQYSSE